MDSSTVPSGDPLVGNLDNSDLFISIDVAKAT